MKGAQGRKERWRDRLRAQGYKQLEVWLPTDALETLDAIKTDLGLGSRNEALMLVVETQLEKLGSPQERAEGPVDVKTPSSSPNVSVGPERSS